MKILRHSSPKMTAVIYGQRVQDAMRNALRVIHKQPAPISGESLPDGLNIAKEIPDGLDRPQIRGKLSLPEAITLPAQTNPVPRTGVEPVGTLEKPANVAGGHKIAERLIKTAATLLEEAMRLLAP
jgi:hypothetical protein